MLRAISDHVETYWEGRPFIFLSTKHAMTLPDMKRWSLWIPCAPVCILSVGCGPYHYPGLCFQVTASSPSSSLVCLPFLLMCFHCSSLWPAMSRLAQFLLELDFLNLTSQCSDDEVLTWPSSLGLSGIFSLYSSFPVTLPNWWHFMNLEIVSCFPFLIPSSRAIPAYSCRNQVTISTRKTTC